MNWAGHAIERLKDYESRKNAAENLESQIELLEDKFTSIRSATTDATPVQGGTENRREKMLIENIATREELFTNLDFIKREIEITEKGLEALTENERKILHWFYINRPRDYVDRLCNDLFISKTELYRQRETALKKFTKACYGIVEL